MEPPRMTIASARGGSGSATTSMRPAASSAAAPTAASATATPSAARMPRQCPDAGGGCQTRQGRSICALDIPEYRTSPQKSTNVAMGKLRARRSHVMNAFVEHHAPSIQFGYRCFDRLLLNGLIQPFQQPERVVGFFNTYRQQYPVSRDVLRDIATQFQNWVVNRSQKWSAPILEAPEDRRDKFLDPYFRKAKPNQVVAIVKGREPARIMIAIGNKKDDRWHLQMAQRWVVQYNFYVNDDRWGRMFVRMCPYLPFSARLCLNQHHWLAVRMHEENIDFQQCTNAFLKCDNPARLQELAVSLTARDLLIGGKKWLAVFTP